jgi:hypothetical protein
VLVERPRRPLLRLSDGVDVEHVAVRRPASQHAAADDSPAQSSRMLPRNAMA